MIAMPKMNEPGDRLDDANADLNVSMDELRELSTRVPRVALITIPVVRVLGSIAVTLAMMLDHMRNHNKEH